MCSLVLSGWISLFSGLAKFCEKFPCKYYIVYTNRKTLGLVNFVISILEYKAECETMCECCCYLMRVVYIINSSSCQQRVVG